MASKHLSDRENWQHDASITGKQGEVTFAAALRETLPQHYEVVEKPTKLMVFADNKGIMLDAKITNNQTGKSLYIEKKTGNNGGNAHERVYKMAVPALQEAVAQKYNTVDKPFFMVFSGKTFQRLKYQNEFEVMLSNDNYAIMEPGFANIKAVVRQIMDIV